MDHIVDEIRQVRIEHAAQFHYDVNAIFADLKRLEGDNPQPRISFSPRRIRLESLREGDVSATVE